MLLPAFEDGDDRMPCFCFGSNSVAQLRERCQNDALVAEAATLPGYHRIFAGSSAKWGGGGVASLVAAKGAACIGSIVRLSAAELDLLDRHEGIPTGSDPFSGAPPNRYRRQLVSVALADGQPLEAVAYIRNKHEWEAYPSEAYLSACHCNLSPFWPQLDADGAIVVLDEASAERGRWMPDLSPVALPPGAPMPEPSRDPVSVGSQSYLTRLSDKGAYKSAPAAPASDGPSIASAASPSLRPVWVTLSVNEVSRIDAREETFVCKGRLYLMWEEDLDVVGLGYLAERARATGDFHKLSDDEMGEVQQRLVIPKVEVYNLLQAEVADPPALRVYSRDAAKKSALMWNAAYMWTCREIFELQNFPCDSQELTLDLRMIDTAQQRNFCMIVHGVQFAAAALKISEWALCKPTVHLSTKHATAVHILVKRRAKFFLVNVVSPVCAITLLSPLTFTCELEANSDRLGITLTLLLTSVAFKLVTAEMLPKVPYLTRLDYLMLGSMLSLFITSFLVVAPSGVQQLWPDDVETAQNFNRALAATALLVSAVGALLWLRGALSADRASANRLIAEKKGQKWHYFAYAEPAFVKRQDEYTASTPNPVGTRTNRQVHPKASVSTSFASVDPVPP